MSNLHSFGIATLFVSLCACELIETSTTEQPGISIQGTAMQGISIQGISLQGMTLQGFRFDGATLGGAPLQNLRVERGELVAERGHLTLRGAAIVGARLSAQAQSTVDPAATALVAFRIADVAPEDPAHDPTRTGSTYLYTIEQWVGESGSWRPACPEDADGRRAAIPLAATWDGRGDRVPSSAMFTFGCTTGVLAKCYRWGYRPWLTGYGDLATMHWACTRLARADYCGDGVPHTREGTWVNVWDTLPAPGPIQRHGLLPPPGMVFEAGWSPHGAVCLSHARWLLDGELLAAACPDRLIPPGVGPLVCNSQYEALLFAPSARLFNESYLNL